MLFANKEFIHSFTWPYSTTSWILFLEVDQVMLDLTPLEAEDWFLIKLYLTLLYYKLKIGS
jgi:hypothetical protein